jgi:tRNA(Ile)-lysidine synthetase-like protein
MSAEPWDSCLAQVPRGKWGVAVSGGGDSVALLHLLRGRDDLQLHVLHLDHQTRVGQSTEDAKFVEELCRGISVPITVACRDEIEPQISDLPTNLPARFRAIRQEFFRQVARREELLGVILAHQADDQAETILLRLLRGGGATAAGLGGMRFRKEINGVVYLRPLLSIGREALRDFLRQNGQAWREDASNESPRWARNRIRQWLRDRPKVRDDLLQLGQTCEEWTQWARRTSPKLPVRFAAKVLAELPRVLARQSARRWMLQSGADPRGLSMAALDRLIEMASDAATAARQQFPVPVKVHRRGGWMELG